MALATFCFLFPIKPFAEVSRDAKVQDMICPSKELLTARSMVKVVGSVCG